MSVRGQSSDDLLTKSGNYHLTKSQSKPATPETGRIASAWSFLAPFIVPGRPSTLSFLRFRGQFAQAGDVAHQHFVHFRFQDDPVRDAHTVFSREDQGAVGGLGVDLLPYSFP